LFILFHCFIFATTKEIRRAECAKQSAHFFLLFWIKKIWTQKKFYRTPI